MDTNKIQEEKGSKKNKQEKKIETETKRKRKNTAVLQLFPDLFNPVLSSAIMHCAVSGKWKPLHNCQPENTQVPPWTCTHISKSTPTPHFTKHFPVTKN